MTGCQTANYALHLASMEGLIKKIGKEISIARIRHEPKLSIEELAEITGFSRQTISSIENGRSVGVSLIVVMTIAKMLKINTSDLIQEEKYDAEMVRETAVAYMAKKPKQEGKKNSEPVGKSASERVPRHHRKSA